MADFQVEDENLIPDLLRELAILEKAEIHVGVFGEDQPEMVMIATVHEFGTTITPKQAGALTVPLNREAALTSARDHSDLFTIQSRGGNPLLVRERGEDIEPMYLLLQQVEIPERSFVRSTFDQRKNEFIMDIEKDFQKLLDMEMGALDLLNRAGMRMERAIVEQIESIQSPPNSPITIGVKGSSSPLEDEGHLKDAITWKVVV